MNYGFQNLIHADSRLSTGQNGLIRGDGQNILNLLGHSINVRAWKVDLVDHGNDLQTLRIGQLSIGQSLGFHSLGCVDEKQCPFTSGQTPRNLVGKIDMAWGIYEIEQIVLSIRCQIVHRNRMTFDGNAAFALQVHGIQKLFLHFSLHHRLGTLEESVGQVVLP